MKKIEIYRKQFYDYQNKMQGALEGFEREIVFSGDFEEEPVVTMAGDGELIAVLNGKECPCKDIVKCMLTKGCVEPNDFY